MSWREISPQAALELRDPLIIDVRSPCEHEAERILGSLNFPLLSDQEREEIGIVYKNEGEITARRRALIHISPKIPLLVDDILSRRRHGQPILVYCWRGGLRSESVASILSIAGFASWRLTGGYKAWRNMIVKDLSEDRFAFDATVLDGLTGVGKTEILAELARQGHQVLDLEKHANHRGSTFGGVGKSAQPSQKNFEEAIWNDLRNFDAKRPVFVEAESRKIGRLSVPSCVLSRIRSATTILVTGSIEERSRRLADDYMQAIHDDLSFAYDLLGRLREFIGAKTCETVSDLLKAGSIHEAIKTLLCEYYDPLYQRSISRRQKIDLIVDGDEPAAAARAIVERYAASSIA